MWGGEDVIWGRDFSDRGGREETICGDGMNAVSRVCGIIKKPHPEMSGCGSHISAAKSSLAAHVKSYRAS